MAYSPTEWTDGEPIRASNLNKAELGIKSANDSYVPTEWHPGDLITAERLNKMEDGIANASGVEVESLSVTENGTYTAEEGEAYSPVTVNVPNTYAAGDEGKVVSNGALVAQTATSTSTNGTIDTTLNNSVTVNVPTGTARTSADLTASGATVNVPAGLYASAASKSVASGSATTPATTITAVPAISVSSGGLITAAVSASQNVTPTVSAGYVSSGTAGAITVNGSNTQQLTAKAAQTYTPTTSAQTIASGQYLTGAQTILGDANLVAANIAKDVSIFGVTGTHEGGGGWTKLYEWEVTANSTSSTATVVATKSNLSGFSRSPNCLYYAVVKDKAGIRQGYFYSNVAVMLDLQKQKGFADYSALLPANNCCFYSTNGTSLSSNAGNNGLYGVYVESIVGSSGDTGPTLTINARYSSTYSKTVNGTYVVQVYQITLPSGATPFPA